MTAPVVLIADDSDLNRKLARDVLRASGLATLEAASGEEAIELARARLPDVILMDIRLPDMDGTDALRRLKAAEATASIPIVALTSLAMKGDRERLLADGFDGYLEKPIDIREFPDQIRRYCRFEDG